VFSRQVAVAARIFVAWDLLDAETGEPLPAPGEGGVRELTIEQLNALLQAYIAHVMERTAPPKA
jgi:hypothetical protein